MEPIKVHNGKTVALMNNNIDTDQIIPKVFLKRIEKTGFGAFVFDELPVIRKALRLANAGKERPFSKAAL